MINSSCSLWFKSLHFFSKHSFFSSNFRHESFSWPQVEKATLKKRKAEVALTIGEPSKIQAMVSPNPSNALEVPPPAAAKCPWLTRGKGSSSSLAMATSKGIPGDQAPGSKVCAFDNWKVAKSLFEEFIHPINADHVMEEGNYQCRKDAFWTSLKVSFPSSF